MSNNIEGKVVAITGASSGLDEASARYLSTQGATVVLGARRHDRIESLARELTARGGKATAEREHQGSPLRHCRRAAANEATEPAHR
jgi:NADP-dependent 3-hydroxy acid dehydrogenase YdfG